MNSETIVTRIIVPFDEAHELSKRKLTYTVCYRGSEWTIFNDDEVPEGEDWEVWAIGLSWPQAWDAMGGENV